jgi:hypothetical protein
MIDDKGHRLYSEMMCLIGVEEDRVSKEVEEAMGAFDGYMNRLNRTTGMLYSRDGEVLMEC